ncbi:MAG: hypothetical protein AAF485_24620 [Chloroflexota bacterium]
MTQNTLDNRPTSITHPPKQPALLRDISIQVKLIIIVVLVLGLIIPIATLLVSQAIRQFEARVTEDQLIEENQLAVIHFALQKEALEKTCPMVRLAASLT